MSDTYGADDSAGYESDDEFDPSQFTDQDDGSYDGSQGDQQGGMFAGPGTGSIGASGGYGQATGDPGNFNNPAVQQYTQQQANQDIGGLDQSQGQQNNQNGQGGGSGGGQHQDHAWLQSVIDSLHSSAGGLANAGWFSTPANAAEGLWGQPAATGANSRAPGMQGATGPQSPFNQPPTDPGGAAHQGTGAALYQPQFNASPTPMERQGGAASAPYTPMPLGPLDGAANAPGATTAPFTAMPMGPLDGAANAPGATTASAPEMPLGPLDNPAQTGNVPASGGAATASTGASTAPNGAATATGDQPRPVRTTTLPAAQVPGAASAPGGQTGASTATPGADNAPGQSLPQRPGQQPGQGGGGGGPQRMLGGLTRMLQQAGLGPLAPLVARAIAGGMMRGGGFPGRGGGRGMPFPGMGRMGRRGGRFGGGFRGMGGMPPPWFRGGMPPGMQRQVMNPGGMMPGNQGGQPGGQSGGWNNYDPSQPDTTTPTQGGQAQPGQQGTQGGQGGAGTQAPAGTPDWMGGGPAGQQSSFQGPGGQAAASAYRGAAGTGGANFMHGQYGGPGQNITTIRTPGGKQVRVNAAAAPAFQGFLSELEAAGAPLHELGGFNVRNIAGSGRLSQHSYGNAIDIDQSGRNRVSPEFARWAQQNRGTINRLAAKYNMVNGGDWRNPDFGHFEWSPRMSPQAIQTANNPSQAYPR